MDLREAKQILNEHGFLVENTKKDREEAQAFFDKLDAVLANKFSNLEIIKRTKDKEHTDYTFDTKEFKEVKLRVFYCPTKYLYDEDDDEQVDISLYYPHEAWKPKEWDNEEFAVKDISTKMLEWIEAKSKAYYAKIQAIHNKKKQKIVKKKPVAKKKLKYTDLSDYKQDIYDALTARGLGMEFALDYVNGLDRDFMLDHQDIKALADEAVREWGK